MSAVRGKVKMSLLLSLQMVLLTAIMGNASAAGYKVLHCGNSYTVGCHFQPEWFANQAGFSDHFHRTSWSPGITIKGLWDAQRSDDHEGDHLCGWKYALDNQSWKPWDWMFLQPYYEDINGCITASNNFYDYALQNGSPDIRMVIVQIWPLRDATTIGGDGDRTPNSIKYYEDIADAMDQAHPGKAPTAISPAGSVIVELRRLTRLGQVPGVTDESQWYSDGGHLSNMGNYAVGLASFVVMYKVDPRNYPSISGAMRPTAWYGYTINDSTAATIKEVVWNVVTGYPRSRVTAGPGDYIPPSKPANLHITSITSSSATLSWTASTDNVGVLSYEISVNGAIEGSSATTTFVLTGLSPSTDYTIRVIAKDAANNTASSDPSIFKTLEATIPVTSVTLDHSAINLNIRVSKQLSPTVLPVDASNKNVTWSSSNVSVAAVADDGTVTGVGAGSALITVQTADGNKTATCTVTVLPNSAPVAAFSYAFDANDAFTVTFDGSASYDPDQGDGILGYDWDFGDNSPRTMSNNPSHTYAVAGTYTVTLVVLDNNNTLSPPITQTISVPGASDIKTSPHSSTKMSAGAFQGTLYDVRGRTVAQGRTIMGSGRGACIYILQGGSSPQKKMILPTPAR